MQKARRQPWLMSERRDWPAPSTSGASAATMPLSSLLLASAALLTGPAILAAEPASAKTPSDVVRSFYEPLAFVPDLRLRSMFIDPARAVLEQADADTGCIDFSPAIDAQDVDDDELIRSLTLSQTVRGEYAEVTASFRLFPADETAEREMVWSLRRIGDEWKIADIVSRNGNWRLGAVECTP